MEFMPVSEFFNQENQYRHNSLKRDQFVALIEKYCVEEMSYGWYNDSNEQLPDLRNNVVKYGAPDIRGYFDHLFSIKTEDGEVFWCSRPYDRGCSMLEVMRMFRANGIQCDVMKGFYADYTIVMRPFDVITACLTYNVVKREDAFDVVQASQYFRPALLERFDNFHEAQGFANGIRYAIEEIASAVTY